MYVPKNKKGVGFVDLTDHSLGTSDSPSAAFGKT